MECVGSFEYVLVSWCMWSSDQEQLSMTPPVAHVNVQDITYEGYVIPKESLLLSNTWFVDSDIRLEISPIRSTCCRFILSNPTTYPDPDVFDLERFLGKDCQPDPREACFGLGRRVYPSVRLAESIIFTYLATVLVIVNMAKCVENGAETHGEV